MNSGLKDLDQKFLENQKPIDAPKKSTKFAILVAKEYENYRGTDGGSILE